MFDVFGSVKGLIKLDTFCIDNNIFRYVTTKSRDALT